MGFSICLALIHNNNAQRNLYIRPHLEKISGSMEPHIVTNKIEVSFQPEIRAHSIVMAVHPQNLWVTSGSGRFPSV